MTRRTPRPGAAHGPARPALPQPLVLIELDTDVSGGPVRDRFDIQLRGRTAARAAIEAVELIADDQPVARIEYGQPERAVAVTLPNGQAGHQRSFQFTLPLRQPGPGEIIQPRIRTVLVDGTQHDQAFSLVVDADASPAVRLAAGPHQRMVNYLADASPVLLYVERASIDARGELLLHGWCVAHNPLVTVQAFLAEDRLVAKLGGPRDDVAAYYGVYPNARSSGFSLTAQRPNAIATVVRVQAISRNGFTHEVLLPLERPVVPRPVVPPAPSTRAAPAITGQGFGGTTYRLRAGFTLLPDAESGVVMQPAAAEPASPDPRGEIHYFCDDAAFRPDGTLRVVGWALCAIGLAEIRVVLDGRTLGTADVGLSRPDVGAEFTWIPQAHASGFRFERRVAELAEGMHEVQLVVRNTAGAERTETRRVQFDRPVAVADPPAAARGDSAEFRFELDSPQVVNGRMVEPVTGRLTIEGWVLARSGVTGVEVALDDQRLGEAHYGLGRPDVGVAFPDWNESLRSGYAYHCPPRALRDGDHTIQVTVRAKNGEVLHHRFAIEVRKSEESDELVSIRRRINHVERRHLARALDSLGYRPSFHLLLRQSGRVVPQALRATVESLRQQAYPVWRLTLLAADAAGGRAMRRWLQNEPGIDADRIRVLDGGAADFTEVLGDAEDATLYGLLCPGDLLGCDALAEIALAGGLHRRPDFLYADEARISPASREREPFFKPDFSPDLLLSTNYIGRPWFATGALLHACAVSPRSLCAQGEYDAVLRCTEQARAIHHVPKLLAQRGPETLEADDAARAALQAAADRRGIAATVAAGCLPGTFRLRRTQPAQGKVSIIIPTCAAHGHIETCLRTLRANTAYRHYEVICIDNIPAAETGWKEWLQQHADRVVDMPEPFNWSQFNNRAAAVADGDYLLFLNDDIEITQPDWLDALLEHAQRPDVGIVGPQLLYPGGKVQHAGMFLGAGIGRHAFRFAPQDEPGYFGLALTQRNVIAVTGACMLMRRSFFEAMHGFEEAHSVINNDVDFCLRTHQAGKLIVFTPYASLLHHELASRDRMGDTFDTTAFDARWRTLFAAGDPFFSPRLSRHADDYRPDDEAAQTVFPGHPLFAREEIRRILVVKLDHIGDFVTALPAIRRLKALFPQAELSLLAGRAARSFIALEPAIDEFIEFEFFHARSQLGEKELTKDDYAQLQAQLAPHGFDLAIDLRKHLSTRHVLRHTGARYLAGYDYVGQFPFLDVALEWDGDKTLQHKRSHVVDDLLALVEAVNTACLDSRELLASPPAPLPLKDLPKPARALFDRPVVAVHAGAGNITKQWPEAYFAALIDLLLAQDGVNVLLVGGPDDRALSETILRQVDRPQRLASVAGALSLADLPRLLARCQLYIGNDSGPKHIAAAVGIPTIGIHSGVVDAVEWGPIGRHAVAVRRNMACSPCYLAKAEDCPRGLACLRYLEPAVVHEAAQQLLARELAAPASSPVTELMPPPGTPARPDQAGPAEPRAAGRPVVRSRARFKPGRQGVPA